MTSSTTAHQALSLAVGGSAPATSGDRWLRRTLLLWAILAAAGAGKSLVSPQKHTVFPVFAQAGRDWWGDKPLYRLRKELDTYRYSPTFAIAVSPLGLLRDRGAGALWTLASVGALVAALVALARELVSPAWTARQQAVFLGLASVGSIRGVWSGQSNSLVLALAVFGLIAVRRERWWLAAWLVAAAIFVKLWPVALAMLLVACWPKQLGLRIVAACTALAAFPFLTRPPSVVISQYQGWYEFLTGPLQMRWPGYRDAWTIWESIAGKPDKTMYLSCQLAAAAGVLIWCLWRKRRARSKSALLLEILAAWLVWQHLFGPGTERLTYQLMAPVASWALIAAWAQGSRASRAMATLAWLACTLLSFGAIERGLVQLSPLAIAALPLGVAVFAVWLVAFEPRLRQRSAVARQESQPEESADARAVAACAA